jgi:hypothetical protein
VALTDIRQVAVSHSDGTKTGILILGGVALLVGSIVAIQAFQEANEN